MKKFRPLHLLRKISAPMHFRCIGCGRDVFDEVGFCPDCLKRVTFNNGKRCKRCGGALLGDAEYCGNCAFDKTYFDRGYSPLCYDGAVRDAILDMKFHNMAAYAEVLSRYLVFEAQRNALQYDVVTFAPISAKTLKKRSYNQARLLAEAFCAILEQESLLQDTIAKIRETEPQEKLSRTERKTNLVGCYRLRPDADVKGKRVLLIDDIKTTGATVNECGKVLKRAGAAQVIALTVASSTEELLLDHSEENI